MSRATEAIERDRTPAETRDQAADAAGTGSSCVLRRSARVSLDLHGNLDADCARPLLNTYAAWPASSGFGLFLEASLFLRGVPDGQTGYLADIARIDRCLRDAVLSTLGPEMPAARRIGGGEPGRPLPRPARVLRRLVDAAAESLGPAAVGAEIALTPFCSMTMEASVPDRVTLLQRFDFAASHRLHCPQLSAERNRELFGKCNNPNGHGHNYRLDVAVDCQVDASGATRPDLHAVEAAVRAEVIDRFDHRHLNLDVPEFATLNPSVENIARVTHQLLRAPLGRAGGTLRSVTVWETEKTGCTYPAPT